MSIAKTTPRNAIAAQLTQYQRQRKFIEKSFKTHKEKSQQWLRNDLIEIRDMNREPVYFNRRKFKDEKRIFSLIRG